jgi:hypothetical protein
VRRACELAAAGSTDWEVAAQTGLAKTHIGEILTNPIYMGRLRTGETAGVAATDALYLENSIARGRLQISAGLAALRLIEVSELEARIGALEQARAKPPEASASNGGLLGA